GVGPGVVGRITLTIPAGLLHPAARPAEELAGSGPLAEILAAGLRAGTEAFSARRSRTAAGGRTQIAGGRAQVAGGRAQVAGG
ncbi:MAG TPA: hypothetical protein VEH31_31120, partial [Streptosporangiaceae bacterium]|nr:hypothetical protein [Streptosporangiaceae bacterium]